MILNAKTLLDLVYQLRCELIQKSKEWNIDIDPRFTETKETEHKNHVDADGFLDSKKIMEKPFTPIELNEQLPDTAEVMKALMETLAKSEGYLHGLINTSIKDLLPPNSKISKFRELHLSFMENGKRNLGALKQKIDRNEVDDPKFMELVDRLLKFTTDVQQHTGPNGSKALDFLHLKDLPAIARGFLKDETTNDKTRFPNGQPVNYEYGQERHRMLVKYLNKAKTSYQRNAAAREREQQRQQVEAEKQRLEQEHQARLQARQAEQASAEQQRKLAADERAHKREENAVKLQHLEQELSGYTKLGVTASFLTVTLKMLNHSEVRSNLDPQALATHLELDPSKQPDTVNRITIQLKSKQGRKELHDAITTRLNEVMLLIATSAKDVGGRKAIIATENLAMDHQEALAQIQAELEDAQFQRQNAEAEQQRQVAELQAEQALKILEMKDKFARDKVEGERRALEKQDAMHKREIQAMKMAKVDMWKGIPKPVKPLLVILMVLTFPISTPIYAVIRHFRKKAAKAKARKFLITSAVTTQSPSPTGTHAGTEATADNGNGVTPQASNLVGNLQDVMDNLRRSNPNLGKTGQKGAATTATSATEFDARALEASTPSIV